MRNVIARVRNVLSLVESIDELGARSAGVPGIGLVFGETGAGKTTATNWLAVQRGAIYVRANATWTPSAMLRSIMRELESDGLSSCSEMLEWIAAKLLTDPRPIFVDEADYLLTTKKLVETLRDIHDMTTVPVILIGMAGFRRAITTKPQVAGRVSQWVEFKNADYNDARVLADSVCEVHVSEDLLQRIFDETGGSMRGLTVALSRVEFFAKSKGFKEITLETWGRRELTLQPAKRA